MKTLLLLFLTACAGSAAVETTGVPESQKVFATCVLADGGNYGEYVECTDDNNEGEVIVDTGNHSCGGCSVGAACQAYYTHATGLCQ